MCTQMRGNTRKFRVLHDKQKILKQVFLFKRWHLRRSVNLLLENYPHSAFLATLAMMKSSVFFSSTPLSFGAGTSTNDSLERGGGGGGFSKLENSLSSRLRLICDMQLHLEFDDQVRYKCPNFNEVCLRYQYSSDSICTPFQCGKYSLTSLFHILDSSSE